MRKMLFYPGEFFFWRIFSGFSAILNVLQSCEVFANFCANYFAKKFLLQKIFYRNLACFALLAFYYNFLFNISVINVRKCVQNVCQIFVRLCAKLFMSFCRILSTLCSQVIFPNVPHLSRGQQKSGTKSRS